MTTGQRRQQCLRRWALSPIRATISADPDTAFVASRRHFFRVATLATIATIATIATPIFFLASRRSRRRFFRVATLLFSRPEAALSRPDATFLVAQRPCFQFCPNELMVWSSGDRRALEGGSAVA